MLYHVKVPLVQAAKGSNGRDGRVYRTLSTNLIGFRTPYMFLSTMPSIARAILEGG